jgi:hypothetical protein
MTEIAEIETEITEDMVETIWQVLDDMRDGLCVCQETKEELLRLYERINGAKFEYDGETGE